MNEEKRVLGDVEDRSDEFGASSEDMGASFDDSLQRRRSAAGQNRLPLAIALAGILIVIVYFVWLSPRTDHGAGGETLNNLTMRLERLEQLVVTTEEMADRLNQMDQLAQQLQVAVTRLDRLEAATTERLDALARKIDTAAQSSGSTPPVKTSPPAAAAPESPGESRQHVVKSGETLYQISRKYGLSVNALRDANQLKDTAIIYPGQKLVIPPPTSP